MNDFAKQLSSYNLLTCLLPGATFCVLMSELYSYPLIPDNIFAAFFLSYFVGLVISRVGSVIVEPFLITTKVVKRGPYRNFVVASRLDENLEVLLETNNVYRSMIALPICAGAFHLGTLTADFFVLGSEARAAIILVLMIVLFGAAYRKQMNYVSSRVSYHQEQLKEPESAPPPSIDAS